LIVLGLGTTGHMMEEIDAFWGEAWVEDLHENLSLALQVLLGLHLVGVFADSLRYRRHTWRSMITGKK